MKTFDKKDVYSWSNAEDAKEYLGKDCYFAHSVGGLSEHIKTGVMGILKDIFNSNYDAVSCAFGDGTSTWGLCLPADKVIEVEEPKKWRAFIFEEFTKIYSMDKPLKIFIYREKGTNITFFALYSGYVKGDEISAINLSGQFYTLQTLFDRYELFNDELGKWQPFGIKVEEQDSERNKDKDVDNYLSDYMDKRINEISKE